MPLHKWERCQRGVQEQVLSLPLLKSRKDNWAEVVSPRCPLAQGVPRGGGQLSRRAAAAPRALGLGASVPRLAALPSGRRVGAWAPQRPESTGQGREPALTASEAVGVPGVRLLGRLLFIPLLFANGRGGRIRLFPLAQLGRWEPGGERAGPGSGARGLFTVLPAEGSAQYLCAASGRSPASRPFPAAVNHGLPASPSAPLTAHRSPPRPTRCGPAPLHPLGRAARAAGEAGGARREAWLRCSTPAPLPPFFPSLPAPPASPPAANRR